MKRLVTTGVGCVLLSTGVARADALNPYAYSSLGALSLTTPGSYVVDTDAGTLKDSGGNVLFTSAAVTDAGQGDVRIFSFDSVFVGSGVTVTGSGSRPLALLSRSTAFVNGTISVNGSDGLLGRGGDAGAGGGGGGGAGFMSGSGEGLAGGGGGGPRSGGGGGGPYNAGADPGRGGNAGINLGGTIGNNGAGPAGGAHSTLSNTTTVGGAGDGGGSRVSLPPGPGFPVVISGTGGVNNQTGGASNPIVSSRPGGGGGGGAANVDSQINVGYGGGGGFGGIGGWGSKFSNNVAPAGRPGAAYGDLTVMLEGGSGGGGGGYGPESGGGGGGGGAFELVAPDGIVVEGAITADGGWGDHGPSAFSFAGAGSGGGIILHGNIINLAAGSNLSADGGQGFAGGGGGRILIEYGTAGSYTNAAGPSSPSVLGFNTSFSVYGGSDGVVTTRQVAIVPEPATISLIMMTLPSLMRRRRR